MEPRYYIYLSVLLAATLIGLKRFRRLNNRFKFLTILVLVMFASELSSRIMAFEYGNCMPIYHTIIGVQCIFYALIYQRQNIKLINGLFIGVGIISLLNSLFYESIWTFPSIGIAFLSLAIVTSTLLDFRFMLNTPLSIPLFKTPDFWMNLGGLFFFTFTFFAFGLMNIAQWTFPDWVYEFIYFANVSLYLMYGLALYLIVPKKKNESIHH